MQNIRVKRTQKTAIGLLHAGSVYRFDPSKEGHSAVAARLLKQGFGEEITEAALKKEKREAEKLKKTAAQQPSEPLASQSAFNKLQGQLDDARSNIAELTKRAEEAEEALRAQKEQVVTLSATIEKLEDQISSGGQSK